MGRVASQLVIEFIVVGCAMVFWEHSVLERLVTGLFIFIPLCASAVLEQWVFPEFRSIRERQDRILQRLDEIERQERVSR